ncbi:hypothetical protein J6590_091303 [Homalodisca vitripennis]|nr:hypothetical protein J6590_091303 [Homalodisca vitripennis]
MLEHPIEVWSIQPMGTDTDWKFSEAKGCQHRHRQEIANTKSCRNPKLLDCQAWILKILDLDGDLSEMGVASDWDLQETKINTRSCLNPGSGRVRELQEIRIFHKFGSARVWISQRLGFLIVQISQRPGSGRIKIITKVWKSCKGLYWSGASRVCEILEAGFTIGQDLPKVRDIQRCNLSVAPTCCRSRTTIG